MWCGERFATPVSGCGHESDRPACLSFPMSKAHDRIRELFGEVALVAWDRDGMDLRDVSPHRWDDFSDWRKCQWREHHDSTTLRSDALGACCVLFTHVEGEDVSKFKDWRLILVSDPSDPLGMRWLVR